MSHLEDNYDLMCYNSTIEDTDEDKLVLMMGSSLMIAMYQNNEIQKKEINMARKLNIPILHIYSSEVYKQGDITKEEEHKVVFKDLEEIEMILKDRFKIINKIKKRKDLPFKTLELRTELFEFTNINSISILKEDSKLILTGDHFQSYSLLDNTIGTFELVEDQLSTCVNNKEKEIIILKNNVFSKYNFDFVRIPKDQDKILSLEEEVIINEIVVNEENKHVYGISNNHMDLFHFDEEFKLKQTMDITTPLLVKVFNNNLYIIKNSYGNTNFEETEKRQLIENENSFINIYSQKENEDIKFKRKIILDALVQPNDFHINENYILIFSPFINKHHLFNFTIHLLLFNHDGILLQKTGLGINGDLFTRFLVYDNQTIYCADSHSMKLKCLKFNQTKSS
jgi:hypothetical protein